jgi:hypothetical protein
LSLYHYRKRFEHDTVKHLTIARATMKPLKGFIILVLMCAVQAHQAAENDFEKTCLIGLRKRDKAANSPELPFTYIKGHECYFLGAKVPSLELFRKSAVWEIKGKISADSRSVDVIEIKEKTLWIGEVYMTKTPKDSYPVLNAVDLRSHSWQLKGAVAPNIGDYATRKLWTVKGRLEEGKNLVVEEMKLADVLAVEKK